MQKALVFSLTCSQCYFIILKFSFLLNRKKMFEKYTRMQKSLYLMIYLEVTIFKEHRMT